MMQTRKETAYGLRSKFWHDASAHQNRRRKVGSFRIAVLGDFSARANSGKLDTGATLAGRKPLKVDCDNLDATLKRFGVKLRLPIG
jgi:predicted component of type VI protein secretion system